MSVAIVEQSGEYTAAVVSGANQNIDERSIKILKGTGILLLQNEVQASVNLIAARQAKRKGAKIWLNAAPARELDSELISQIDVLIVNRVEAKFYSNLISSPETEHITKILTLGDKGVELHRPDQPSRSYPAYAVKPLSTHGAGDMFVGALASSRLNGSSFEKAIHYAQAAAALHVSRKVEMRNQISRTDVLNFIRRHKV